MMNKNILTAACLILLSNNAVAGEWNFEVMGKARSLFGYSDFDSAYSYHQSRYNLPMRFDTNLLAQYNFNDEYQLGAYLDLAYGVDQELKDYNHGSWGEEAYLIFDSPYGRLVGGQSYNAAYQLGVGAPDIGGLGVNQSDIVNFVSNPNWQRNHLGTAYKTLNSTEINTDGTAPKITYISPEYDGMMYGLTYVPNIYSRDGLVNRHASYKNKDGYIASVYHNTEYNNLSISVSVGAAHYEDTDNELSGGMSFYYKGWTLGGSVRKTFANHKMADISDYDRFREGLAYNAGLGYEIGPFKSALTYFYSKADNLDYEDKIIQLAGSYQLNKNWKMQLAVAHGDYEGDKNNQGYAFISGVEFKF